MSRMTLRVLLGVGVVVVAAIIFLGGGKSGHEESTPDTQKPAEAGKKVKYWQAPMDPTFISDKPGKSPMGMDLIPVYEDEDAGKGSPAERKVKYWQAPMDPTFISDKPGKSPMGMDLIPVYEDESDESAGAIRIDPVMVQNIGVRTEKARHGSLSNAIRMVGNVTYDEDRVDHIHTRISGWVEKLYVGTLGEEVKKGQELLSIYSPELVASQEEYLQALRYREKTAGSRFEDVTRGATSLIKAAERRLLLMNIDEDQIRALRERGEVQEIMTLRSPKSGIVIEKTIFEGKQVTPAMDLFTIADLSRVWVIASAYEYELPFLRVGQEAEMTLPYEPGKTYKGRITFIYPYLKSKTRTVQVRMEFENPDLRLKPDMYADVTVYAGGRPHAVLISSEAVIRTGIRNIVILALGDGKFLPTEVTLGLESQGTVEILSGLRGDETVVTSGQFLIDSESNLRESINKMLEAKKKASSSPEKDTSGMEAEHEMSGANKEQSEKSRDAEDSPRSHP